MKTHDPDPELLALWFDGQLDDTERARFENDLAPEVLAAIRAERAVQPDSSAESAWLRTCLREIYPPSRDVADPTLFMHQLEHRMDRAEEAAAERILPMPTAAPPADVIKTQGGGKRKTWWLEAAAAAIAVLAVLNWPQKPAEPEFLPIIGATHPAHEVLVSSYAPDARITMDARYDAAADAVVILLDGLPPVEKPADLVGYQSTDPRPIQARLAGNVPQAKIHAVKSSDI